MGRSYDMKKHQEDVKEIKKNLEAKKAESEGLEQNKQQLMEAMTEVLGAKLDDNVVEAIHEAVNNALEANSEKGQEISDDMNRDIATLENIKQETQESINDAQKEKDTISKKQSLLEKFGIGSSLDSAVKELDANVEELEALNEDVTETMNEAMEIASKLSGL